MKRNLVLILAVCAIFQSPAHAQREMLFGPEEMTRAQATAPISNATKSGQFSPHLDSTKRMPPAGQDQRRKGKGALKPAGAERVGITAHPRSSNLPAALPTTPAVRAALPDLAARSNTEMATPREQFARTARVDHSPIVPGSSRAYRAHANPFQERKQLARAIPQGPIVGIFPGLSTNLPNNYESDQVYLPLLNHLSREVGVLLVPGYQANMEKLRREILSRRYPVLYVSTLLADEARRAGYRQIIGNDSGAAAAFIVRAKSPIMTMRQLAQHSIAIDSTNPVSSAALDAIQAEGIENAIRLVDSEGPVLAQIYQRVFDGSVDAGVVSNLQATILEARHPGVLRVLKQIPAGITDGFWVAPGALEPGTEALLVRSLVDLTDNPRGESIISLIVDATGLPVRYDDLSAGSTPGKR